SVRAHDHSLSRRSADVRAPRPIAGPRLELGRSRDAALTPRWSGAGPRRRHRRPEPVEDGEGRHARAIRSRGRRRDRPDGWPRADHRPRLRAAVEHPGPERGRRGEAPGWAAETGARRDGVTKECYFPASNRKGESRDLPRRLENREGDRAAALRVRTRSV